MLASKPLVSTLLFLTCNIAAASDRSSDPTFEIFSEPTTTLSIRQAAQDGVLYGAARAKAKWHVSQWNNPSGDILDFVNGVASSRSLDVVTDSNTSTIRIQQNGSALACDAGNTPTEFDGLIGTNTRANNVGAPTAEAQKREAYNVGHYSALMQKLTFTVIDAGLLANAAECRTSKGVSLVAVVFTNHRTQTSLFLQAILYQFNTSTHNFWWARGTHNGRFGFNFVVDMAESSRTFGHVQTAMVDFLPIFRQALQDPSVRLDRNADHWFISGAYFGNALYGHIRMDTAWSGYSLVGVRMMSP